MDSGPRSPAEVGRAYDEGAEDFDARFAADPKRVRRFRVLDAPQRAAVAGCDRVLELGCGSGRLLATLDAGLRAGVDVSAGLLAVAARRGLPVLRADAHRLPFCDASFDAVVSGNAVFRELDTARAFAECARVLRPGGRLCLHHYAAFTWSPRRPFRFRAEQDPRGVNDLSELRCPAAAAGFVEEELFLFRGLAFAPWAIRLPEHIAWRFWDHLVFVFRRAPDFGSGSGASFYNYREGVR